MYIDNYMFNVFLHILYTYRTISYHWYKRALMFCMVIQNFKGWLCEKCVFQCVACGLLGNISVRRCNMVSESSSPWV